MYNLYSFTQINMIQVHMGNCNKLQGVLKLALLVMETVDFV